jgi:CarD family transcriptional regulator
MVKHLVDVEFQVGRYVVYPTHGVGKINEVESNTYGTLTQHFYVIYFEKERMTLRVPVNRARAAGLRALSSGDDIQRAFNALRGKAKIQRGVMWSKRQQMYESKINSGNMVSIAEVLRDLHRNVDQPDRSYSERVIYESALDRLAGEVAAAENIDPKDAVRHVVAVLDENREVLLKEAA